MHDNSNVCACIMTTLPIAILFIYFYFFLGGGGGGGHGLIVRQVDGGCTVFMVLPVFGISAVIPTQTSQQGPTTSSTHETVRPTPPQETTLSHETVHPTQSQETVRPTQSHETVHRTPGTARFQNNSFEPLTAAVIITVVVTLIVIMVGVVILAAVRIRTWKKRQQLEIEKFQSIMMENEYLEL